MVPMVPMVPKSIYIDSNQIHAICDFRDTPLYRHINLMRDMSGKTDEEKVIMGMVLRNIHTTVNAKITTLKNAHVCEATTSGIVIYSLHSLEPSKDTKTRPLYDGIYDIILQQCMNIRSLCLVFEHTDGTNVECRIPVPDIQTSTYRIPLAFSTENDHEDHIMYMIDDDFRQKVSFIPTCALAHIRRIYLRMNTEARATASISTVYLSRWATISMVCGISKFWVHGDAYMATKGKVYPFDDAQYNNYVYNTIVKKPLCNLLTYLQCPVHSKKQC